MSIHDDVHAADATGVPESDAARASGRRDPFGIGLARRPGWESFGVLADDQPARAGDVDVEPLEIRRRGLVTGVVGLAAAGLGLAWFGRALADGGAFNWTLTGLLALLALAYLAAFVDGRVPLAVVDSHGVRMRLGRTWQGLPWETVDRVEHVRRGSWWHDGRLVVVPFESDEVVAALDRGARFHAWWAKRWYGGAFALPLGLSTHVRADGDVSTSLHALVDPVVAIIETAPAQKAGSQSDDAEVAEVAEVEATFDDAPLDDAPSAHSDVDEPTHAAADEADDEADDDVADAPQAVVENDRALEPAAFVAADGQQGTVGEDARAAAGAALRERSSAAWERMRRLGPWTAGALARLSQRRPGDQETPVSADVSADVSALDSLGTPVIDIPAPSPLREPRSAARVEVTAELRQHLPLPEADALHRPADSLEGYERDDLATDSGLTLVPQTTLAEAEQALRTPVIGPEFAAARQTLGLSVDQVAERTRIRPHVIEAIEVDDFAACGGDFYARGHLRTLARILGVDSAQAVATYDTTYADAPIDARRVFEAELASVPGGSLRATRGGPNWSVLVAAVMSLVLLWAVAQLLFDGADSEESGDVAGLSSQSAVEPVEVELTAPDAAVSITVRDADGEIVWQGDLGAGESHAFSATPPVRVSSSDGGVTARVSGGDARELGASGVAVQRSLSP